MIGDFLNLLGKVSAPCLLAVLTTFVGTATFFAVAFWRALIKGHLVMGFVHWPTAKRLETVEQGYTRLLETGRGFRDLNSATLATLEESA